MNAGVSDRPLTIGDLSRLSGCSVPTIRYYEKIGLLPPAARRPSGHRFYGRDVADRLLFIRHCRDFDFSIEQLRELLSMADDPSRDCIEALRIAKARLDAVRAKQRELRALERSLAVFVNACTKRCAGGPAPQCSIFQDLGADGPVAGRCSFGCQSG